MGMKTGWGMVVVAGLTGIMLVMASVGCRQAEEGSVATQVEIDAEDGRVVRAPAVTPTVQPRAGETPAKLPREEGRIPDGRPAATRRGRYRVAVPIPGKPGFGFNPHTNNSVDLRGLPSGTLVRDPQDPDECHKFRAP